MQPKLYKSTATRILARASGELSANDYAILAYEYWSDSEYPSALRYYQSALRRIGGGKMERLAVLRSLGALLLQPSDFRDPALAKRYFSEALGMTAGLPDDYSRYTTGYTHEMFGFGLLLLAGSDPTSRESAHWQNELGDARRCYEEIAPMNPCERAPPCSGLGRQRQAVPTSAADHRAPAGARRLRSAVSS